MNILFTSSGRRVELLKRAKSTLINMGEDGNIVAADASKDVPTSKFCDTFELIPRISSPNFIESLLEKCRSNKIDILIPTIDTELIPIAENLHRFKDAGVLVNISNLHVIKICRNKKLSQKFFEENGIGAPKEIPFNASSAEVKYPVFIKPLDGSSSINTFKAGNAKEFDFFKDYVKNPLIQEMIDGDEFTVDMFCDADSKPITVVPRRRLAVRSGEILKGRTEKDRNIINASIKVANKLKPFGHITLQCIKNKNKIYFIEINPRFGGGAPMSIDAGANSIENLIKLKRGQKLEYYETWKENLTFSRFDDSVII